MKKNYVYVIAPVAGLVLFAAVYWKYASGYEEKLVAADKARIEQKNEKIRQENLAKAGAVRAALEAQDKRKKEKRAREERDAKEKEQRELAQQARVKAREDARKFQDQVKRLSKEVEENKKELAKIEEDKKRSVDEQKFQREFVKKAEANTQSLSGVLERIAAADKAAEDAARAAAAAAVAAAAAAKK
ncbi:MAG: hypothetical protein Q7S40_31895 [Opitutaceae bacterium]|nr:hypothetical protein [Opitutaceae bacterium]